MRLVDGPAEGVYAVRRAPLYLRAVVGPRARKDVLDGLDDEPEPKERIHVYQRVGEVSQIHIKGSRSVSGFYVMAEYRHMADVDGEQLRETKAWRAWCREAASIEMKGANQ
jgi:hypothetical protein